ncbi:hypothetical protein [Algoriphagus litoralis]|uniref:hypothetical protein n=1 Tax=Algoriphagus litoralis TaxID=2202829 RepID=UPI000DBA48D6|nr:hypothetical protein [Algoriphagus litoralis]
MKNTSLFCLAMLVFSLFFACGETEEPTPTGPGTVAEGDGISESDLETYAGEVGLTLNLRQIARKGLSPAEVEFEIQTTGGILTEKVPVNEVAYIAVLKIPVEDLTEAQSKQLTDGVKVNITVKDQTGKTIASKIDLGIRSLLPSLTPIVVDAGSIPETEQVSTYLFGEGTGFYFQTTTNEGVPGKSAMTNNNNVMFVSSNTTFSGAQPNFLFNISPVLGKKNTFHIRLASTGEYLVLGSLSAGLRVVNSKRTNLAVLSSANQEPYQFVIKKLKDGVFQLLDFRNRKIQDTPGIGLTVNHSNGKDVLWRIVANDIKWAAQPIASTSIQPILPKPTTGFTFNSTLTNCSSGQLQQTVGIDFSEERTTTVGWSETISVNTTQTVSVSATVGVEVSGTFFGSGATASASITSGFEWSQSITSESTEYQSQTISKRESYFSSRVITVPPRTASLVYDAYQYYENVRVNHVQRIRITGKNEKGRDLTGDEIRTIFLFSNFNGVVNAVEENSVVITLLGYTVLDKFIDTQSKVQEVAPKCN